jgi:hypothetical protein
MLEEKESQNWYQYGMGEGKDLALSMSVVEGWSSKSLDVLDVDRIALELMRYYTTTWAYKEILRMIVHVLYSGNREFQMEALNWIVAGVADGAKEALRRLAIKPDVEGLKDVDVDEFLDELDL